LKDRRFMMAVRGPHVPWFSSLSEASQPGLYGALNRIQALGLELVGLSRLVDGTG
jgi:hypothetical protein